MSIDFVQQEAARLQRHLGKPPAVALRALLRFLSAEGQVVRGLEAAVPMPRQWALASLPAPLDKDQVSQVLAVCRTTPPNELRNTAVLLLLLLARLELRAGEVAALCLEEFPNGVSHYATATCKSWGDRAGGGYGLSKLGDQARQPSCGSPLSTQPDYVG